MISLNIPEVKTFMTKLLMQNVFDSYLLQEMELKTFTDFTVSGQLNEAYYSEEELEGRGKSRYIMWRDIRSIALSMIKGNKSPLFLKIVFQLPKDKSEQLVQGLAGRLKAEDVGGLFINIRFEKGKLNIITGTAIKTFTLDKTLEQEWDREVKNILHDNQIAFEE